MAKEIGGYFELENFRGPEYHDRALALNCGRTALAYLIEAKKIQQILIPYFLCSSVKNVCYRYKSVKVIFYHINEHFLPDLDITNLNSDIFLYVVNYYGMLSNSWIAETKKIHPNLIIDNSQAFFQMQVDGVDTIYSPRKYFGIADGAYLYTNVKINRNIKVDLSYSSMNFILGRYETNANLFYKESIDNNSRFEKEDIKEMSRLTHNLLRAIDYSFVNERRFSNASFLASCLNEINKLDYAVSKGIFMYPLMVEKDGDIIRKEMQLMKIYVPKLWPDCDENLANEFELNCIHNILPLPIDQRYDENDMKIIVDQVYNLIS